MHTIGGHKVFPQNCANSGGTPEGESRLTGPPAGPLSFPARPYPRFLGTELHPLRHSFGICLVPQQVATWQIADVQTLFICVLWSYFSAVLMSWTCLSIQIPRMAQCITKKGKNSSRSNWKRTTDKKQLVSVKPNCKTATKDSIVCSCELYFLLTAFCIAGSSKTAKV